MQMSLCHLLHTNRIKVFHREAKIFKTFWFLSRVLLEARIIIIRSCENMALAHFPSTVKILFNMFSSCFVILCSLLCFVWGKNCQNYFQSYQQTIEPNIFAVLFNFHWSASGRNNNNNNDNNNQEKIEKISYSKQIKRKLKREGRKNHHSSKKIM